MTRIARIILTSVICATVLTGCTERPGDSIYPVVRLDRDLAAYSGLDMEKRKVLRDSLRPELEALAALTGDSLSDAMLEAWSGSTAVDFFQPAVDSVFPDIDKLERSIGEFYAAADKKSLPLPCYRMAAVTWPSYRPLALRDSVVFIALNHYLGHDYEAYSDFEPYQRALKDSERLPYDVASGIIRSAYPYESSTDRLFERMLYEGAVAYAQMQLIDSPKLEYALGFTPGQMEYLTATEGRLWQEFGLRRGLLYSTDPEDIRGMMDIGARSPLDSGLAPGGVGRYIGYRIVESYLREHPSKTLSDILSPTFHTSEQSLVNSSYAPAK